jgi:hypothetical protein
MEVERGEDGQRCAILCSRDLISWPGGTIVSHAQDLSTAVISLPCNSVMFLLRSCEKRDWIAGWRRMACLLEGMALRVNCESLKNAFARDTPVNEATLSSMVSSSCSAVEVAHRSWSRARWAAVVVVG